MKTIKVLILFLLIVIKFFQSVNFGGRVAVAQSEEPTSPSLVSAPLSPGNGGDAGGGAAGDAAGGAAGDAAGDAGGGAAGDAGGDAAGDAGGGAAGDAGGGAAGDAGGGAAGGGAGGDAGGGAAGDAGGGAGGGAGAGDSSTTPTSLESEADTTKPVIVPTVEVRDDVPNDGCDVNSPNTELAPVYVQMLNEYESVLMPKKDLAFKLRKNIIIFAICPSGFMDAVTTTVIKLKCVDGELKTDNNSPFDGTLICVDDSKSELFEKKGDTECPKTNYAIGLNISGQIITYAESCYDVENEELYYVHYRASKASQFVSSYIPEIFLIDNAFDDVRTWDKLDSRYTERKKTFQEQVNLRTRRYFKVPEERKKRSLQAVTNQFIYKSIQAAILQVFSKTKLNIAFHNMSYIKEEINNGLKEKSRYLHFHEANLFPPDTLEPFVKNPFYKREFLQKIFAWDSLVLANWRYFQKLLRLRAKDETFEVYIGTSETMNVPVITINSGCIMSLDHGDEPITRRKMEINDDDIMIKIPKYIWAYIKTDDPATSFVVIGVNTPFYEYFSDTMLTCNDMCETVPWLQNLEKFRRYDPFGIIFCCPVNEVKDILYGFPIIS